MVKRKLFLFLVLFFLLINCMALFHPGLIALTLKAEYHFKGLRVNYSILYYPLKPPTVSFVAVSFRLEELLRN